MDPFTQIREELIKDIVGITDPFLSNAITAFLFLALILFMIYSGKIIIEDIKWRRKIKRERLEREKKQIKSFQNNKK
jgi:hypothetical protein